MYIWEPLFQPKKEKKKKEKKKKRKRKERKEKMEKREVESIFNAALELKRGEEVAISLPTQQARDCARVQLYQEKRNYQKKNPYDPDEIMLKKHTENGKFLLILSKVSKSYIFYKREKDGTFIETPPPGMQESFKKESCFSGLEEEKEEEEKEEPDLYFPE